jgi:hypothetical protein
MALEVGDGAVDRRRQIVVVGVEPADQLAPAALDPLVDGVGLPAVGLGGPLQARIVAALEELDRAVVGRPVDDEVLVRGPERCPASPAGIAPCCRSG